MAQPKTQQNKKKVNPSSAEADAIVMDTLFKMATEDKNTAVLIFWAKARCGMSDKGSKKQRNSDQAPTIVIRTEEKRA